jgi:hypothetical protein
MQLNTPMRGDTTLQQIRISTKHNQLQLADNRTMYSARGEIDFGFALALIQNALIWRNWRIGAISNRYEGPVINNSPVCSPDGVVFGRLVQCPITLWVYKVQ